MQATNRTRISLAALATVLVATALIAGVTRALTREAPGAPAVATSATAAPGGGTPTGEFENGIPVYRLPAIEVVASRRAELARMAKEAQLAMR
jgi:hypothetical protein